MTPVTKPLRDEHRELLPHIQELRSVADAVGTTSIERLRAQVNAVYAFLTEHLIPHAHAEDAALYPVIGRLMGAAQATATMSRDHVEVGRLTAELDLLRRKLALADLDDRSARELRRVLYGLHALVSLHFAKEEEIYLPLIDMHLADDEARAMFAAMERAAEDARAQLSR
jgi:iron-sulfur cluster repair protein YtfE (RIC family)